MLQKFIFISYTFLLSALSPVLGNEGKIETLKNYVSGKNSPYTAKAQYYYINSSISPETAIDEQMLTEDADTHLTLDKVYIRDLAIALLYRPGVKIEQSAENLRLVCIYYDHNNVPLLHLCISANGLIRFNEQTFHPSRQLLQLILQPLPEMIRKDIQTHFFEILLMQESSNASAENRVDIDLQPQLPTKLNKLKSLPPGNPLLLKPIANGLETRLKMGDDAEGMRIRLEQREEQQYIDRLCIDKNKNTIFDDDEKFVAEIIQGKLETYLNFNITVPVPVLDPEDDTLTSNEYSILFFYTSKENMEKPKYIWATPQSWMFGHGEFNSNDICAILVDADLNGVFDFKDRWVIVGAEKDIKYSALYTTLTNAGLFKNISEPIKINDIVYQVRNVHPSGRHIDIQTKEYSMLHEITQSETTSSADENKPASNIKSAKRIMFYRNFDTAVQKAKITQKPLFIDFETDWCGYCKKMDQFVYTKKAVIDAAENVIAVKVDGDKNKQLTKQFQVKGYPTMVLLSHDGTLLKKVVGYQTAEQIAELLSSVN